MSIAGAVDYRQYHFNSNSISHLDIISEQGDIYVRATRSKISMVRLIPHSGSEKCRVDAAVDHGTLRVRGQAQGCIVDMHVEVPVDVETHIDSQGGNVFVSGIHGDLHLHLALGNAVVGGQIEQLEASLDRGGMSAMGLKGGANIRMIDGRLQLYYERFKKSLPLTLEVGTGSVLINLPPSQVQSQLRLLQGSLRTEARPHSDNVLVLNGTVGKGDVTVHMTEVETRAISRR